MSRPDFFTAPTRATAATAATQSNMTSARPALPAFSSAPSGAVPSAGFSATFRAVQADVSAYLANGSSNSTSAPAGASLNADGAALRARLQAGRAIGGTTEGVDNASQLEFLEAIRPYAEETGQRLGVSPDIVAAHAALESGWGQRPVRTANGGDSNNLFGIKASGQWQGDVAASTTTEYEHGAAVKRVERFRSYPDQAAAFRDYADVLTDNPRYQAALNAGTDARAFARGLAAGGYATDPSYAEKLAGLAARIARK
ncbi:flagellar assembly peptidoglycan hydrolase FlgJ [Pseudoduganella sp. UC29_106]|uniref:flagellar assembly peptidoglycan hydrolase FlgJ n=1 Tax=Pseudoduganella sp. UC29_106 TaxID=3374553 RepID=UPI0037577200